METYTFIKSLKKDIYNIRSEIDEIRMENLELRLAIAKLQNPDGWDVESVASNDFDDDTASEQSEPDVTSECSDESEPDVTSECASHVNYELSHLFLQLVEKEDNLFKKKAYEKAANIIKEFPDDLTSSSQLEHISGIGKGITNLIEEFFNTGTFKKLHT